MEDDDDSPISFVDEDVQPDFIGFSPVKPRRVSSVEVDIFFFHTFKFCFKFYLLQEPQPEVISEDDIAKANSRAKLLHVYRPGINFVPGAVMECLEARDNKW